jgi:hypothetical protein
MTDEQVSPEDAISRALYGYLAGDILDRDNRKAVTLRVVAALESAGWSFVRTKVVEEQDALRATLREGWPLCPGCGKGFGAGHDYSTHTDLAGGTWHMDCFTQKAASDPMFAAFHRITVVHEEGQDAKT